MYMYTIQATHRLPVHTTFNELVLGRKCRCYCIIAMALPQEKKNVTYLMKKKSETKVFKKKHKGVTIYLYLEKNSVRLKFFRSDKN
jgi:hypothetical protein